MKIRKVCEKTIQGIGWVSGLLVFVLAIVETANTIFRYFFNAPLAWGADLCRYLLIYIVFLSGGYAFFVKSHCCVDLVTNIITKNRPRLKRILKIISYLFCYPYLGVLCYRGYEMTVSAIETGKLTNANWPIPISICYFAIFFGCAIMLVTVTYIIIDLITGGDKYVE